MTQNTSRLSRLSWVPLAWYAAFLFGPLVLVLGTSFATRGVYGGIEWTFSAESYRRAFDPLFSMVIVRSFGLATLNAGLCFLIGFPMALGMSTATARWRKAYVLALAIPFLTNLMIRVCALKTFFGYDGPFAQVLNFLGMQVDRFSLSQNLPLVIYGMVSSYLPFMVLPLFAALERFDFELVEAAQDLGARYAQVIFRIILPAVRHAIVSGVVLVFIPSFGEFVIPDILGGAKVMLIGNLISEQYLKSRDWPFGSALSILLMLGLGGAMLLIRSFGSVAKKVKREEVAR
jgi:spermidine/putrescine transport system permease protein